MMEKMARFKFSASSSLFGRRGVLSLTKIEASQRMKLEVMWAVIPLL